MLLLSRGEMELSAERRRALESFILAHAEPMLPGLREAILYKHLLSPQEFHGLSSAPRPVLPKAGFRRPDSLDTTTRIHHIGNSVHPPEITPAQRSSPTRERRRR